MKILSKFLLFGFFPTLLFAAVNDQPEIRLIGGKDRVLPIKQRDAVLEASEAYLNRSDEAFLAGVEAVENPYSDGAVAETDEIPQVDKLVVYDDASILELIETNFSPQVRGTIAKGNTYYLQLNGGGLLGAGDSFPAQVPQIEGEFYMVIVQEITPDGYALKMNDSVRRVSFEKRSGIIKDSAK